MDYSSLPYYGASTLEVEWKAIKEAPFLASLFLLVLPLVLLALLWFSLGGARGEGTGGGSATGEAGKRGGAVGNL
ncbi:hypothetical protein MUK42_32345 [Musa troglodytarum]|uniref:Uncharacterized protein n=1 Tax=Musa troglodytarum TaxID=320322 RepID=A0A9E7FF08_9LILI|nr:hypothetical protein MUK42_32345 [Musa troglodytarum]